MVLTNTQISLLDIRNEHSLLALDPFPITLTDYYRNGLYVDSSGALPRNSGIPLSGSLSLSAFIGSGYLAPNGYELWNGTIRLDDGDPLSETVYWTVPDDVISISILCIGGGGGGRSRRTASPTNYSGGGGSGAGLSYSNNIAVTPGEELTIIVGSAGYGSPSASLNPGSGGFSAVKRGSTFLCYAEGGLGGASGDDLRSRGGYGGLNVTAGIGADEGANITGGGNGGEGGISILNDNALGGGGGGAGGYSGNGGRGGNGSTAGSGGGGGGGTFQSVSTSSSSDRSGGGGVGAYGEGANGTTGTTTGVGGGGGSGGTSGGDDNGIGGDYGGGGGGCDANYVGAAGRGGIGAVRIIWGDDSVTREFPSTNTQPFINYNFSDPTINNISGTTIYINGWNIHNERAILTGSPRSTIGGFTAPLDTTKPANAPINPDAYSLDAFTPNYEFITPTDLINGTASGKNCVRLYLTGNTSVNYGIIHGPYVISADYIPLNSGQGVGFDWRAAAGDDAYDVYAYLLKDDGTIQKLLDRTQNGTSGDTGWLTVSDTVAATGNYKFVFVSGTYDYSGGQAVGASLYVTNISIS